jgi:hypothetical protein
LTNETATPVNEFRVAADPPQYVTYDLIEASKIELLKYFRSRASLASNTPDVQRELKKGGVTSVVFIDHRPFIFIGSRGGMYFADLTSGIARHIVGEFSEKTWIMAASATAGEVTLYVQTVSPEGIFRPFEIWVCPASSLSKLDSQVYCDAYTAPALMNVPLRMPTTPSDEKEFRLDPIDRFKPETVAITAHGWTWLLSSKSKLGALFPAQGVVNRGGGSVLTYRAGRLDTFADAPTPAVPHKRKLDLKDDDTVNILK